MDTGQSAHHEDTQQIGPTKSIPHLLERIENRSPNKIVPNLSRIKNQ